MMHHIKQVVAAKFTELPEDELSLGERLMSFISDLTEGGAPFIYLFITVSTFYLFCLQ